MLSPRAPDLQPGRASGARALRAVSVAALLLVPGCGGDESEPGPGTAGGAADECPNDLPGRSACEDGAPTYRAAIAPIIDERCNLCHYAGNRQTGVAFSDYDAVYARRQTLQSRVYSCVMPPDAAPPLAPAERAALLEWLVCGAPER